MKKLFILTILLFSVSASSQVRRWFYQPMNCYIDGFGARCQTINHRFQPIYCEAQAVGLTSYGFSLRSFFRGWIQRGQSAYVFVRANNPYRDPLVNVHAQARCLF